MHKLLCCAAIVFAALTTHPAAQAQSRDITCRMDFTISGWSAFYRTSSGQGVITCNNGQRMNVQLEARGGGLSFGRTRVNDGQGVFSGVYSIRDTLGGYATAEAHAGAGNSAQAQVVTKGPISLALSGRGTGVNLGVSFGSFIISER